MRESLSETKEAAECGARIREMRLRLKMSGDSLAVKVGCSQSLISQFERGVRMPGPLTLRKVADALGCKVYELTGECSREDGGFLQESEYHYRISHEEYVRLSESYEKLTLEGRRKAMEYIEDIAALEKYQIKTVE